MLLFVDIRHDNFALVSHLVAQNSLRDVSILANVSGANAGNLAVILTLAADLLYSMYTSDDTRYHFFVMHALNHMVICFSQKIHAVICTIVVLTAF